MTIYCLDTSAILDGWVRFYPPDVLPTLWEKLERAIEDGAIISPDDVLIELKKKDDDVHSWAKAQSGLFLPLDDSTQDATSEILAAFPRLVKALSRRNQADPFVVALAKVKGATVVTAELAKGSSGRPKIPDVCAHFGVPCMNLISLMRAMGWKFR